MPRSSISMATFDGGLFFDINQYLIDTYENLSLPERRAICMSVQQDDGVIAIIEEAIDEIIKNEYDIEEPE